MSVSYRRFSRNLAGDFVLAAFVLIVFFLYRLFLVLHFSHTFDPDLPLASFVAAFVNGMRYDAVVAGYTVAIPVLLSIVSLFFPTGTLNRKVRTFFVVLFGISAAFLLLAHFLFYLEFNHSFDDMALSFFYDDTVAIVKTAWRQHHLGWGLIAVAILGAGLILVIQRAIRQIADRPRDNRPAAARRHPVLNFILGVCWILIYVILIRGSVGIRPVEPKDAAITRDPYLNSHIINPFMAMAYAVENHFIMVRVNGIDRFLGGDTIRTAVSRLNHGSKVTDLDTLFVHRAKGATHPPRDIFLIVMESMDAWSLLDAYRDFDLLPNLKALGRQGILIKKFLPASSGTMTSLAAIITGLPDAGVLTSRQPQSRRPYPTSLAPIFKALGYRTRVFYGGYLSWYGFGDFCTAQGFDEIYGGAHMGNWRAKEWGVDDEVLFNFIENHMDSDQPTFNLVLSTTYHSPYDIDLARYGFPYTEFPKSIHAENANVGVDVFGHLWYTDKILGEFIRRVHHSRPDALFAVTGDHRSHNFIHTSSSLYERLAVPLLIYNGRLHLDEAASDAICGSHLDIGPTLVELAAPSGFVYHSLGDDLLDPNRPQTGIGQKAMITPETVISMTGEMQQLSFGGAADDAGKGTLPLEASREWADHAVRYLKDYYAQAWWRIMKGPDLPIGSQ